MNMINDASTKSSITVHISQVPLYDKKRNLLYFCEMENDDFDAELPSYIKKARSALRMTQDQLAEALGCTKSNISGWENGRHVPTYKQLRTLSKLSGVPLPHDEANDFIEILGLRVKDLDVDQVEIIKATTKVPKEDRPQVRKIVGTFTETDCEKKINE